MIAMFPPHGNLCARAQHKGLTEASFTSKGLR